MTRNTLQQTSTWGLIQTFILIGTSILAFHEVLVAKPEKSMFFAWFDGRIQAMWFVLAGVALYKIAEGKDRLFTRRTVLREGLVLIGMGLLSSIVWKPELLLSLGLCIIVALPFLFISRRLLWPAALLFALVLPAAAIFLDLDVGWDFSARKYIEFWNPSYIPLRIFLNGYYPVIPYTAFVLIGVWLGKKNLHKSSFRTGVIALSLVVMFFTFFSDIILGEFAYVFMGTGIQGMELFYLFRTEKIVAMPVFIMNTVAWSFFICMVLVTWVDIIPLKAKTFLANIGYAAPWLYAAQILVGIGVVMLLGLEKSLTLNESWLIGFAWLALSGLVLFMVKRQFAAK